MIDGGGGLGKKSWKSSKSTGAANNYNLGVYKKYLERPAPRSKIVPGADLQIFRADRENTNTNVRGLLIREECSLLIPTVGTPQ